MFSCYCFCHLLSILHFISSDQVLIICVREKIFYRKILVLLNVLHNRDFKFDGFGLFFSFFLSVRICRSSLSRPALSLRETKPFFIAFVCKSFYLSAKITNINLFQKPVKRTKKRTFVEVWISTCRQPSLPVPHCVQLLSSGNSSNTGYHIVYTSWLVGLPECSNKWELFDVK